MSANPSKHYRMMQQEYPELLEAVESLGKAVKQAGPVDEKTAQLIQLAAAAACRSEGAVHSHTQRALAAGASAEEVRHSLILLTSTLGFPCVMAALSWAEDKLANLPSDASDWEV
ncbi:carboxymuconolactone decarboxylase family protein [Photobacterium atrarenae]|uniref:Carboxymuconolactone decarboxylase family protein n=1 Tax=Photobacterium atrarenae TaxID=865757 RepID=A0ABY5GIX4_9GAMM|nr:carboxymuconolactone decarboxylase family protein [Photobacterium atrarenae]UTV29162.1 carboxymuconolactone decarboxylase family protein [Photobacterium atrarenae]